MQEFYYNLQGGLNTSSTALSLGSDTKRLYWCEMTNVEPYKKQGVKRQKGNVLLMDFPEDVEILSLHEYPKNTGSFVFVLVDGRVFFHDAKLKKNLLIHSFKVAVSSVVYSRYLDGIVILPESTDGIFFNIEASEKVKPLNGVKSNGKRIEATSICQFSGRLWLGAKNTLYYSALGCFDDWTSEEDAGYIAKFHASTTDIVALSEYSGCLAIYKSDEVFLLSGNSPESFSISKFADKGAAGATSVLTCNNKQYFFNNHGVFSLSQVGELSQIMMSGNIADRIFTYFENLDGEKLHKTRVLSYEIKSQIWFFAPYVDSLGLNQVFIYDYSIDAWFKRLIPYEIVDAACVAGKIYTVTRTGKVYTENVGNTFGGKPVEFKMSSPFFNFSKPTGAKIIDDFSVIFDGNTDNNLNFSVSKNYITQDKTEPEILSLDVPDTLVWVDSLVNDTFDTVWSGDLGDFYWANTVQEKLKTEIFDANTSVQLHFEGDSPCNDFTIVGFEFKDIVYDE